MATAQEAVDLTQSEDDLAMEVWVDICPVAKPSVRFGPGRGGGKGFWRRCIDTGVRNKMNLVKQRCKNYLAAQGLSLLPRRVPVIVEAWFFLKRPDSDFVNNQRGLGRLKESAKLEENTVIPIRVDIDNMAKFILDSLTGALHEDDCQVVELHVFEPRDSIGPKNVTCCWQTTGRGRSLGELW